MTDLNSATRRRTNDPAGHPLKVLILSLEYVPKISGGVGTHALELAAGLGKAGCRVNVLAYTPGPAAILHDLGVTAHLLSPTAASSITSAQHSMVKGILAFNEELLAYSQKVIAAQGELPDIIQFYNWITFPAARSLEKMFGIPAIGTIQFVSGPIESRWGQATDAEIAQQERRLFSETSAFITVSHSMKNIIHSAYQVPLDHIHVVYNGMDVGPFKKSPTRTEAAERLRQAVAGQNERIVLFAGRLHPQKGISAIFASAAQVLEKNPNVRYLFAGEPDSRDFKQVIDDLLKQFPTVRNKLKLLGKLQRQQLAALYQIADLALVPSVYEPFGYAVIEAMAAGVPVITTDAGGPGEIVQHRKTGLIVPVRQSDAGLHMVDVEQLAAAQIELLNDEPLAMELARAAQERVEKVFNRESMTELTIQAYRQTISSMENNHENRSGGNAF